MEKIELNCPANLPDCEIRQAARIQVVMLEAKLGLLQRMAQDVLALVSKQQPAGGDR